MKQWIIEMPEGWKGDKDCVMCGAYRHICQSRFKAALECPYANAKEAVEVKNHLNEYGKGNYNDSFWFDPKGKPVKLFAVKEDRNNGK
jgi:hypothetical protein